MEKRYFIEDPLWGIIELFPWEAKLLNQFLVNRLHNVIQTSCAYLVYPGLRYSRFLHSLGVMHVATQMFVNLIANSDESYRDELAKEAKLLEVYFPDQKQKESFIKTITQRINCPQEYTLLLASVRISSLLHDLGHLPYSHVFESALERFIRNSISENAQLLGSELPQKLSKLHSELNSIFESGGKIHEMVGHKLLQLLTRQPNGSQGGLSFVPLIHGAIGILAGQEFPISKSLLSADIDADRIDFVNRDGSFSGLFTSSVDFGRLFAFYELSLTQHDDGSTVLRARPSPRATAESEKLVWERFLDYKYVMAHHKVHLFDEILERLIFFCICDGSMNSILETLSILGKEPPSPNIEVIKDRQNYLNAEKVLLSNFNDSWVDVTLRLAYEEAHKQDNDKVASLRKTMYEGLSERRNLFKSVFKRDEDYHERIGVTPTSERPFINSLSLSVCEQKYRWERLLSDSLGTAVIIGDLSRKLRTGVSSTSAAKFFGLHSLLGFLESKFLSSRQFNVWYHSPSGEKNADLEHKIIIFLKTELSDYVERT